MCGIVGAVGMGFPENGLLSLAHRGPDSQGFKRFAIGTKQLWLAHTRLAILDLSSAGHQPMNSSNGRWWITYNGEIYNHLDLRRTFTKGCRGHSDTETLLELIASDGISKSLSKLNGMFAFAALDTQERKLYLVRDPFGVKPLYYTSEHGGFAFASEVRALKEMGGAGDGIDRQAMQLYLTLRYVPSPMTLWKGIKRLAPGYVLCLDLENGRQLQWCYVKPEDRRFIGDQNLAIEEYGRQLHEAIERQLLSDVPVGLLLSGGIDSALIAAVAKQAGQALPCFSVGFGSNHSECELADAEQTANTLELPFSRVQVTSEQLLESLPDIVNAVEEPMGTTSVMPMWFLIEHTRKSVKVVLTGQGSDEPWGGYRRYQMELVRRLLPSTRFWGLLDAGANVFAPLPEIIERGLRSLPVVGIAQRAVEACALFSSTDRQLLTGDAGDGGALIATKSWYQWLDATGCSAAEKMMRVDARMNLSDDLLLYGDKISMAHSLEARVPMLDTGLVSFIESLPLGYRLGLGRTKIVHKKLAQRFLPNSIVRRKKKGFQVPFSAWSRGPWQSFIENMLFSSDAPHWEILRKDGLRQLWSEHLTSRPDRSRQFFALLMLAIWWRMQ